MQNILNRTEKKIEDRDSITTPRISITNQPGEIKIPNFR